MPRRRRSGTVTFLRAHELGTGFGPDEDKIDVEFVGQISGAPGDSFGETLRNDDQLPAHRAMFQLLRDGLVHDDLETTVEYDIAEDRDNGMLVRVELRPE